MSSVSPSASTTALALALLLGVPSACSAFGAENTPPSPSGGSSDGGDPASTNAPAGLPGAPAGVVGPLSATEGDQTSVLGFATPDDSGSPIVAYQYDVDGDEVWRSLGPDRLVLGLTNGTTYRFRVRAVNGVGPSGAPSAASNPVVPYGAPLVPAVTAKATSTRVDWTWPAPDGNGRPIVGYLTKLDQAAYGAPITKTTYGAAFVSGPHTLCVKATTSGEVGRNESAEKCAAATIALPTAVSDVTGDAFTNAVASGTRYNNEIVLGKTYSISGACFTANDIGSNNGWWYRNAATGHWAAATIFVQQTNQFGATRVSGGAGGCN